MRHGSMSSQNVLSWHAVERFFGFSLLLLSVHYNAWHWTDITSLECMYVCLSICESVRLSEIPIVHYSDGSFCPIFLKFET